MIEDYYERRSHSNTTQRGKLAKAIGEAGATSPPVDWESRYKRLEDVFRAAALRWMPLSSANGAIEEILTKLRE